MTEPTTEATEAPVADATPDEPIADESSTDEAEPDTFPREVVEKLRQENGKYRQRAQQADTYATGCTPNLSGPQAGWPIRPTSSSTKNTSMILTPWPAAVDDLLARKPHLASRKPTGDIGQGQRGAESEPFSLLELLKERT